MRASIASLSVQPSPNGRRVGIRIVTFEACSGFTHVTARRIAQPPKATFVTRLQPMRLPAQAARQLPDQSTTLRVESSSTDDPRLRGALPIPTLTLEAVAKRSVHAVVVCCVAWWAGVCGPGLTAAPMAAKEPLSQPGAFS